MQRTFWPTWKSFLAKWGMISPTHDFLDLTQPLLPLVAQMMCFGMPFFKGTTLGHSYCALLGLLEDGDELGHFMDYLHEAGA